MSKLQDQLRNTLTSDTTGSLLSDIETQITTFPNKLGTAAVSKVEELDSKGTELWNTSTRLRRQHGEKGAKDMLILLLMTRVFAFLLLACAHEHGKSAPGNLVRVMKAGLKASKNCLGRILFTFSKITD